MCSCGGGDVLSVTVAVDCMKCDRQVNSKLKKSDGVFWVGDELDSTLHYTTPQYTQLRYTVEDAPGTRSLQI
jgi:ABC-type Zn2+ transport system substrate-binding protein/surface adhesin